MIISELSANQVLLDAYRKLGLLAPLELSVSDEFIAAALRRQAGFQCPCSSSLLKATIMQSLTHLIEDASLMAERVDNIIDNLLISGDFLELDNITTAELGIKSTWIFAAPPAFVVHPLEHRIFLLGIAPDEAAPLEPAYSSRIEHFNNLRYLEPIAGENLPALLIERGFHQYNWDAWLKAPKKETADKLITNLQRKLSQQPICGDLSLIQILDSNLPTHKYKNRWTSLKDQTGTYVARRPQQFGSPLWGYVEVRNGSPVRFLDFPLKNLKFRGCDYAWYVQMAIDHLNRNPQKYKRHRIGDEILLEFFVPLPLWARRRLSVSGTESVGLNSLFSYSLPIRDSFEEERFLNEQLWLTLINP